MAERVKWLMQKRTSLKSQITNLTNLFEGSKIDDNSLKLRMARLTELYNAFEEHNDELMMLELNENVQDEFINLQDRFYNIASKIDAHLNRANLINIHAGSSNDDNQSNQSAQSIKQIDRRRRVKLPEAPLPTFDGKYDAWLSFKNAFHNLIDSQPDLSDVDKLHYLKTALKGDAATKIDVFTIDGVNYAKAWAVLERAYEVKRILISQHISAILNLPTLEKESTDSISKIADKAQQHVASLQALGVNVSCEMVVHIIETKLPRVTLDKWEASLVRDEFPSLDLLYEFLYKTAVCASKRERS